MKKKVAFLGIFLALALIFSYVESLIPINFGIPGMKLGLANIVIVILLYFCCLFKFCHPVCRLSPPPEPSDPVCPGCPTSGTH